MLVLIIIFWKVAAESIPQIEGPEKNAAIQSYFKECVSNFDGIFLSDLPGLEPLEMGELSYLN